MKIQPFLLERYFVDRELEVPGLKSLSSAGCEPLSQPEILAFATAAQLKLWDNLSLGYTESYGNPELRETIAALYPSMTYKDVIGVEPTEGIFVAMNCLLDAGDHVIAGYPIYQPLYQVADSIGCSVSYWKANPEGWYFDVDELEALIQPNTRLIVINFPHNPTGATLTHQQLTRLVDIARKHGCYVFSDELFRWSEQDVADRLPAVCDLYEKGVTLSGMSKSFALPGLRIGWLATREDGLIDRFSNFKDYTTGCSSAPSEILALIALSAQDQIISRTLKIIGDNLNLLTEFFEEHEDRFRWYRPKTSLVALVELLDGELEQFANDLLCEQKILIAPGSVLDLAELKNGRNYFRLGFGHRDLPGVLDKFRKFLTSYQASC